MAIIKTYPLKSNYYGPDRLILSDMQPDSEGNVSGDTRNLTLSSLKSFLGADAVLNLTTTGSSGASTYDANTNTLNVPVYEGDTYDLTALQKSGVSVPLKLNATSGTDSQVSFTEGTNITLTRNSAAEITISATGGSAAGSNTQFQYNNSGAFAGTPLMVITGNDEIQIGQQTNEQGKLIVSGQAAGTSGLIKIEGKSARGVTFSVQPETNVNYDVVFPDTGPGGNNKILESDTSGNLAWISTPTGINVVGNPSGTASADLSKITIGSTIYAIPTQGLTSVGLSAPPAFSVTGSPLTSNGSISIGVTGGTAGEFLGHNGQWATPTDTNSTYSLGTGASAGQIILTGSNPSTSQTVTVAGANGISITQFTSGTFNVNLNLATSSARGGVKIGFTESGKNYPVELSSEKMFVNVPWTDTNTTNITLTTTGTSGAASWNGTTLNIPQYSSGSGGGISFSGTTSDGLATYASSSTADVSSKVTLNANGLMQFDADGDNAASIDYNPSGKRLQIGDFQTKGGIVEFYTNGNKQFQIGVNGQIGVGTGSSAGTSGQLLMSQGSGSSPIWSNASGTTPGGAQYNIQFNSGAGTFQGVSTFNWELSGAGSGVGKLIIGKSTTPQFSEGIIRLLGDGVGNTSGTIELQSALGKSGGAANTFKIQGPVQGDTQTLILPEDLATVEGDVLTIDTITGTEVTTKWDSAGGGQTYTAGTGISINSGNVISNTNLGSSQLIFSKVNGDQGQSPVLASTNQDTLKIQGGTGISVTTTPASNIVTVNSTGTGSANIGFQCYNMYEALEQVPKSSSSLLYVRMMVVPQDTSPVNRVSFFCTNLGNGAGSTSPGTVQVSVFRSASLNPSVNGSAILMGSIDSNTMVADAINTISFTFEEAPVSYSFTAGDTIAVVVATINGAKVAGSTVGLANDGLSRGNPNNFSSLAPPEQFESLGDYVSDNNITAANTQQAALTFWAT